MVKQFARELNSDYDQLVNNESYLSVGQCEVGAVYFVDSASIGEIAVYMGVDDKNDGIFIGLKNTHGHDYTAREYHKDSNVRATVQPYAKIAELPDDISDYELVDYLQYLELGMLETKFEWMNKMPNSLKQDRFWNIDMQDTISRIELIKSKIEFRKLIA